MAKQILRTGSLAKLLESTKKSKALFERANEAMPSGSTRSPYYYAPYPLYMKTGQGCYVWDVDGNRYLDFTNNMGPLVLGHRHPAVEKAVAEQVAAFWCGGPTENEVKLSETIKRTYPMIDLVGFTPTGTEASMKLIRAARATTGRNKLMMSTGAYHGTHDSVRTDAGIPDAFTKLIVRYRHNNEESFLKAFKENKKDLAAVLLEGVLGHAGSVPPTKSFLRTIREETEKAGIPFIYDEVVTGFRIARGGGSERFGVAPDGIILGKVVGGGFPIGAFLGTKELMSQFSYSDAKFPLIGESPVLMAGTFNAHAVTMAAGLATLDVLTQDAFQHLEYLGNECRRILTKLCEEQNVPYCVTGIGSLFMIHFSKVPIVDAESAVNSDERKGRLFDALMLARGVNLPAFHTKLCSLPMGKIELKMFEEAAGSSLEEMKAMGEL